ncbi:MAG: 3-phosphoshikimate 1-carboxyvinyltransferase [Gammaproteobacteria bacterium]
MRFSVLPGGELRGEWRAASDKSISHRAVLLASLAEGTSEISRVLMSEDVRATIAAVRACGAEVREEKGRLAVSGGALKPPAADIDCGNSGTLMRLFAGVAAGWGLPARLVGDSSLMRRPMRRISAPLAEMGANIAVSEDGAPPVVISSGGRLRGMAHNISIASAQVKSAILLAGLRAEGETSVTEPFPSRDHTERMLDAFNVSVRREKLRVSVSGGAVLSPARFGVPADISSAAFFMAGAAISPGSEVVLKETGINPTRAGVVELLRRMGARIEILNPRQMGAEPAADIQVLGGELRGIDISAREVPAAIDEFPALFVAAAAAKGETTLSGAGELRRKESDRISAMSAGLRRLGVECEESEDGICIEGRGGKSAVFAGGEVDSQGDHRIAMAFAVAALRAKSAITVRNCDNVATSFPDFVRQATAAGLRIAAEND